MHAFVVAQLSEVDDGRLIVCKKRGEPLGVAVIWQTFAPVAWIGPVASGLFDEGRQGGCAWLRFPFVGVDAGWHLANVVDVSADVGEDLGDVRGPYIGRRGAGEGFMSQTG